MSTEQPRRRRPSGRAATVRLAETTALLLVVAAVAVAWPRAAPQQLEKKAPAALKVLTFNVWHGLRSDESRRRFPGEEPARREQRLAWQIEELRRLDPDVLLLQEVNPAKGLARRYAEALGYDVLYKTTSCGLHLGAIYKIPSNMNEGLAILARPELGLRPAGTKRLSGNARCTASWGFQTKESRYVLFGEITLDGERILIATTHLSSPAFLLPGFESDLGALLERGVITEEQHDEILHARDRKVRRNLEEAERLLEQIERRGAGRAVVVLGGDFNARPEDASVEAVRAAGFVPVAGEARLLTWDPLENRENQEIGGRRSDPLPSFGIAEVSELYAHRSTIPRQIDHLFFSGGAVAVETDMVLTEAEDGILPSDHFGILAELRLSDD